MTKYIDLLSKPFEYGGRGPQAYDCYGLTMEMFKRTGVVIANYPSSDEGPKNVATMLRAAETDWEKVPAAQAGCAVTFRLGRFCHIGYMLTSTDFIHVMEGTCVTVESVTSILWRNSVTGFYRWKGDDNDTHV